ncbi:MAG: rhodanese-related sulfurtransferase [Hyphomicrobium sp.]|nr:rhodanese-related sulfurtransferase [Hyphomicrobium sp.]
MTITISAFYKFVAIDDPAGLKERLAARGCALGLRGTILIAHEGINATISGTSDAMTEFLAALRSDARFQNLVSKESLNPEHPFRRFKVKVRPEIVTFGQPDLDPAANAGTYVKPEDWNALIQDPSVVVVDTRNFYEFGIGTFEGAIDPQTATFRDFPNFVSKALDPARDRKLAMFCTGGIRCEKATAYLRSQGFEDVYHLEGGILKYLEVVPREQSLWRGECFIFDKRIALEHGVTPGDYSQCPRCGYPVRRSTEAVEANDVCSSCATRASKPAASAR